MHKLDVLLRKIVSTCTCPSRLAEFLYKSIQTLLKRSLLPYLYLKINV
ncbi:hypothetical protein [Muriicola jejuensis]|uniref:Uncharacterized protein n=1 Tax=Muriicola jejuensis TaxID=504488 RepID=A0A6P0UC29_9FLAO|nr:hypothetical protein [Muriicola jejuensis]NER10815.1 hypothetical protein [Muriicola jejuensis]